MAKVEQGSCAMKNPSFFRRMRHALAGLRKCWRTEGSFRGHLWRASLALPAMLIVRPAPVWWALAGLVVAQIFALELVNSAIE